MAFYRVRSAQISMSRSQTLADLVPNTILSRTMSISARPYSESFTSSFCGVTNCSHFPLAVGLCCAVCTPHKLDLTLLVHRPGTYHNNSAELSVQCLSCSMRRIPFFPIRLPKGSDSSIFLLRSSPSVSP